jgi:hypothetical protein
MSKVEQELALYRNAVNEIDDRIEYTDFDRQSIYEILDRLTASLAALHGDPRFTLTDLGNAYRSAMKRKAKLGGAVKAGEEPSDA